MKSPVGKVVVDFEDQRDGFIGREREKERKFMEFES